MTIFEKIIHREIPAVVIYEDEDVLAFMDIAPLVKGHVLVIPKSSAETMFDLPEDLWASVMRVARRIGMAQRETLGAEGVNILQNNGAVAGQVVPHVHVHVIPRYSEDGHHWNWNPTSYESNDEMAEWGARIERGLIE